MLLLLIIILIIQSDIELKFTVFFTICGRHLTNLRIRPFCINCSRKLRTGILDWPQTTQRPQRILWQCAKPFSIYKMRTGGCH